MRKWLFLLCLCLPLGTTAQFTLSDETPIQGESIIIGLSEPATELILIYRPRSSVAERDTLRADVPTTTFQWIPEEAGVVSIVTPAGTKNVSVRYPGLSTGGLIVMVVAGGLLFGGAAFAFRLLFQEDGPAPPEELEVERRPDT